MPAARSSVLLASALLLSLAAARAVDFENPSPNILSPSGTPTDAPAAQETTSPCECAATPRCWHLVMTMDAKMVALHEEEVEKAMPNRFFPATLTFTLRQPTPDGHFLIVKCGADRHICTAKRDALEGRLIKSSLLSALPLNLPEGTLYDPETLKLTEGGEKVFQQVKSCRKGLLPELAAVVLGSLGQQQ